MSTTDETAVRVTIDHSADGTTATFEKEDLEARAAVKAAGFRWSGRQRLWYLNSRWSEPTRRVRVRQVVAALGEASVHVDDGGVAPSTTAAEREERARERAAERAERLEGKAERLDAASDAAYARLRGIGDQIPLGQPILVGHHSEKRHRKAIATMDGLMGKSVELGREADAAARSAEIAARSAAGTPVITRLRRIERKSAELRDVERRIAKASSEEYRARMEAMRDTLVDEIAHDQAVVEASGREVYGKADVAAGDVVIVRGQPHRVVRANAKSVTVPSIIGGSWTDTIPYLEITRVVKAGEVLPSR